MGDEPTLPGSYLAAQVKYWRTKRGLSAEELGDRAVSETGTKIDRFAISKIERRGRKVTVDEWLALAYALAVPPLRLLVPLGEADTTHVLPDIEITPMLAWRWITGEQPPTKVVDGVNYAVRTEGSNEPRASVMLYQQMAHEHDRAYKALRDLRMAEYIGGEDRLQPARARYVDALTDYAAILTYATRSELLIPRIEPSMLDDMAKLGIEHPSGLRRRDSDGIEVD